MTAASPGPRRLVTILAALNGVGGSVVMAGAVMELVFLISGGGHDEHDEDVRCID